MIKYILHGGNSKDINSDNDSFFAEMTKGTQGKILILLNYFARDDEEIEKCAESDKKRFLENSKNKELEFEIATTEKIVEQLSRAQVMWVRGGETAKLVEKMRPILELEKLFEGKTIGGSSAGVYLLSKYYWENDTIKLGEGLGLLNWKTYCHYEAEDTKIIEALVSHKEELPLICLPNYKWFVIFK